MSRTESFVRGALVTGVVTFLGAWRNRVLLTTLLFVVVLVALSVGAASVSLGDRGRLVIDVGLAAASAFGAIMTIALSVTSFSGELRNRTALIVLARPPSRAAFVVGKWLGVWAALSSVSVLMIVATALVVWLYAEPVGPAFWANLLLAPAEVAMVAALALLFSTLAHPVLAASYTAGIVLVGNVAGDLQAFASRFPEAIATFMRFAYAVLPDLQGLSTRAQAANALPIPEAHIGWALTYATTYTACVLLLGVLSFSRRRSL